MAIVDPSFFRRFFEAYCIDPLHKIGHAETQAGALDLIVEYIQNEENPNQCYAISEGAYVPNRELVWSGDCGELLKYFEKENDEVSRKKLTNIITGKILGLMR